MDALHKLRKNPAPQGPAVLALGFRPFFLSAGLLAAGWMGLWLLVLAGRIELPSPILPTAWHGHEMVYGYTTAVIAGFLLTAVRNWTNQPMPTGRRLGALVAVWWLGRLAMTFGPLPYAAIAAVDLAFVPLLAWAVAVPIIRAKNRRNLGFVPILLLLWVGNWIFHMGQGTEWASRGTLLGLDAILLIIVVIGGRVIPAFTQNAINQPTRKLAAVDWLAFGATALMLVLDLALGATPVTGAVAIAAGVFNLVRMAGWKSFATLDRPILWILHLAYLWVPAGLVLKGLSTLTPAVSSTGALHALTAGAIGTITLGMMTRVSLGHTGRTLAVSTLTTVSYVAVILAAIVRVAAPVFPETYTALLTVSGLLWTVAFTMFLVEYVPILVRPRVDGRPG